MSTIKNLPAVYATLLAGAVIVVVGAILVNTVHNNRKNEDVVVSPAPTVSPTVSASPSPEPVETVAEPSPTKASPSASPTNVSLPSSARTFVANFYAAYNSADRARLETYFTEDTNNDDKSLRYHLFKGIELDGSPAGGPHLFDTNSANQRATGYSITTASQQGSNWVVTVQEQRVNGENVSIGSTTTLLTLKPSGSTWLIDNYIRSKGTGKYSAFLTE
jgi:hypothetical protein